MDFHGHLHLCAWLQVTSQLIAQIYQYWFLELASADKLFGDFSRKRKSVLTLKMCSIRKSMTSANLQQSEISHYADLYVFNTNNR